MCAWDQWDQIDYFHTVIAYIFSLVDIRSTEWRIDRKKNED